MDASQDSRRRLRAAIVVALDLADQQGDNLVAALLAEALEASDRAQAD